MIELGKSARAAARILALASDETKNTGLRAMAAAIREQHEDILLGNARDLTAYSSSRAALSAGSSAFLDRLTLNEKRIEAMASALEAIAELPNPVGRVLATMQRPNDLKILRISVPIGVIGMIYESRPNVTADAAGLCLKSGNAVILRCGSESLHSSTAIVAALHQGLAEVNLPRDCVQIVPSSDRSEMTAMLKMNQYIDVIIPRGGPELLKYIAAETTIPVLQHLSGLCHTYIHIAANKSMAKKIVVNAKMRRPGICGATEVLLIDEAIAKEFLPEIFNELIKVGCEIRGEAAVRTIDARVHPVQPLDFDTEFLAPILAVKIVKDISAAITHIAQHGTQHTDAIITDDKLAAEKFIQEVESAIVMHNTSTQFADGGEFGMGAEIGIATGKLHARGPVGVEQLTTFKYVVKGQGQIRG